MLRRILIDVAWVGSVVIAVGAFLGMAMQRSVGPGFSLVAAPIFSVVLGAFEGVLLANALAVPVAVTVLWSTWRKTDVRKWALLASCGAIAAVPGAVTTAHLPAPVLQMSAGCLIGAVTLTKLMQRRHQDARKAPWWATLRLPAAGVGAGFLNATIGASGPPVAIYAAASRWDTSAYIPTLQLTSIVLNLSHLLSKVFPNHPQAPS